MSEFSKIAYYDLRLEALNGRLENMVGRTDEMSRLARVLNRRIHNNCVLTGPSGVGKTSFVRGWVKHQLQNGAKKLLPFVQLEAESFDALNSGSPVPLQKFKEALDSLPYCILFIDDFGQLIYNKPTALNYIIQLLKPLAEGGKIQLILAMESKEFKWLQSQQPNFLNYFETLNIAAQPKSEQLLILEQSLNKFNKKSKIMAGTDILELILQLTERFPTLGQLPAGGVAILDESLALAQAKNTGEVTEEDVYKVTSDKTGVPLEQLKISDKELLQNLETELNAKIIGQKQPLMQITSTIKRARLGLKNPSRPLGSFLCLGPSGVGKTETAKLVAEKVFGKKESFVRIDMSEFAEAHTVARLIGSPAGYVGFDAGGGLTNAVKQQPYSLVLLDEIEKAHSKIFDIFLQILDDGRLTSGQGETVDFTQTIIMATSNLGVAEIINGFNGQEDISAEDFLQKNLIPALAKAFRMEFLNRFDAILVFNPLTQQDLLEVAKLEIKKVEQRVARHKIKFKIDPTILIEKIRTLSDPRFGARPVKRFVETTCEDLITQKLLNS
jgi:ATP-dependent Clp protease ATP-binding subunit ClpC